jgi:hypothetical protein
MATYIFIASATASSGNVASFDFTSIPQTYTDLVIIANTRNPANDYGGFFIVPNGSTFNTNTTAKRFGVYGTTNNYSTSTEVVWNIDNATSYFANCRIYIPNYTSSTSNKVALLQGAQTGTGTDLVHHFSAWKWAQTGAITRIELRTDSGTNIFKQYSSAHLYGISKS